MLMHHLYYPQHLNESWICYLIWNRGVCSLRRVFTNRYTHYGVETQHFQDSSQHLSSMCNHKPMLQLNLLAWNQHFHWPKHVATMKRSSASMVKYFASHMVRSLSHATISPMQPIAYLLRSFFWYWANMGWSVMPGRRLISETIGVSGRNTLSLSESLTQLLEVSRISGPVHPRDLACLSWHPGSAPLSSMMLGSRWFSGKAFYSRLSRATTKLIATGRVVVTTLSFSWPLNMSEWILGLMPSKSIGALNFDGVFVRTRWTSFSTPKLAQWSTTRIKARKRGWSLWNIDCLLLIPIAPWNSKEGSSISAPVESFFREHSGRVVSTCSHHAVWVLTMLSMIWYCSLLEVPIQMDLATKFPKLISTLWSRNHCS